MYNYSKLLGLMREKNVTQENLAESVGMSEVTLNKKLNNNSQFKQSEMVAILKALSLPLTDIVTIFFTH